MRHRLVFIVVVGAILLAAARASAQAPSLAGAAHRAVRPGATTQVVLRGSNLSGSVSVSAEGGLIPAAAKASVSGDGPDRVKWTVDVPPEQPVGVGVIRLVTRDGVSNALPIMVDDLPSVAAATGNSSPPAAQAVTPPVAVDGACSAGASDYYRFAAKKGQRISVEVVAARLGSQLDPAVRLLDAGGNELVAIDDTPGVGPDCRFAHTFAADGDYVLEVRDSAYAGGPEFFYRLRVGDFPLATVPFPLGVRRGTTQAFTFTGSDSAGAAPVTAAIPADALKQLRLSVRYVGERGKAGGSGFVAAAVGERDEAVEAEPNDSPESATPLTTAPPLAFNGRFDQPGDRDFYRLAAKKGERRIFSARTRSLGSPCDVRMQLLSPGGKKLAESKVEGAGEGTLDATFPEDGDYRLMVEDLNRAGGPGLAYRIAVERYTPGFSLSIETDRVNVKAGESFEIKVTCVRRDYAGPIALSVQGAGITSEASTIPTGKNEGVVKAKAPPAAPAGGAGTFKIVGTAEIGGEKIAAEASTMPALRRLYPRLLYPPDESDGVLVLGVRVPAE